MTDLDWAPASCTLPTVERPLREQEFSELFAMALRRVRRVNATRADLILDPTGETVARDLAARETSCCSFFTFDFAPDEDSVTMTVTVPAPHAPVLEALVVTAEREAGLDSKADAA
ncbi:hypothetical protein [Agromyces neolithicus]|uniref:Arsenate reductase n=1 Tax=Agromyces neolithicus TaxID=269420 RepID=A0ABN2MBH4_9MICO